MLPYETKLITIGYIEDENENWNNVIVAVKERCYWDAIDIISLCTIDLKNYSEKDPHLTQEEVDEIVKALDYGYIRYEIFKSAYEGQMYHYAS